jgi:hypothetical protein
LSLPKKDGATSGNGCGDVESARTATVLAVRERKDAFAIVLLKACISVYFEGSFSRSKVKVKSVERLGIGCSFEHHLQPIADTVSQCEHRSPKRGSGEAKRSIANKGKK